MKQTPIGFLIIGLVAFLVGPPLLIGPDATWISGILVALLVLGLVYEGHKDRVESDKRAEAKERERERHQFIEALQVERERADQLQQRLGDIELADRSQNRGVTAEEFYTELNIGSRGWHVPDEHNEDQRLQELHDARMRNLTSEQADFGHTQDSEPSR